jgi:hypothetical protein
VSTTTDHSGRFGSKNGRLHKAVNPRTFSSINHFITKNIQGIDEKTGEEDVTTKQNHTKQPLQEPTRLLFTPLPWRARGTVRGAWKPLEQAQTPWKPPTDLLTIGPTGHVNPFVDIEINSL